MLIGKLRKKQCVEIFGSGKINRTEAFQVNANAKLTPRRRHSAMKWKNTPFRIQAKFKSNPSH